MERFYGQIGMPTSTRTGHCMAKRADWRWRSGFDFVVGRRHWRVAVGEAEAAVALIGVELEVERAAGGDLQRILERHDRAADGGIGAALHGDAVADDVAGDAAEVAGEVHVKA